jgi:hypothetical protein
MDENEVEPREMPGVIHVGRTTTWSSLSWFGEEMRVVHVESTILV